MKQCMEKRIALKALNNPDTLIKVLEHEALMASKEGWYFVSSFTDEWLDTVTLFFEKDVEV